MANWKKFLNGGKIENETRKKSGLSSLIKREKEEIINNVINKEGKKTVEEKPADSKKGLLIGIREKVKKTSEESQDKVDNAEEKIVSKESMKYACETYESRMEVLQRIYLVLRTHLLWGEEEDKTEEYGAKNLLEFLGFEKDNLIQIFMAVFGINPKLDQDFEIKNALCDTSVKNFKDCVFRKMLGCSESTDLKVAKEKIDEMAARLTLPELLSMNKKMIENIGLIYSEIIEKESEGNPLTIKEKITIAAVDHGMGFKKQPTIRFDEEKIAEMIEELHSDGRRLDQNPQASAQLIQAPQPAQPQVQPTVQQAPVVIPPLKPQPAQPQAQPTVQTPAVTTTPQSKPKPAQNKEEMERDKAIKRLCDLVKRIHQANADAVTLITQISEIDISLGFKFLKEKNSAGDPDIKKIIAEHFDLTDEKEINAKIMEIDTEFQEKNIY